MKNRVYSTKAVKIAEQRAINLGVSEEELIGKASDRIVEFLNRYKGKTIAFLCGGGNNGSDALMTVLKTDCNAKVFVGGKPNPINARLREKVCEKTQILPLESFGGRFDVVVDGLCGTGLSREVSGEYAIVIKKANAMDCIRVALDIPTGLDDYGRVLGNVAFCARYTLALGGVKYADILNDASDYCGEVVPYDIGLDLSGGAIVVGEEDVKIDKRKRNTHKGNYGRVKVVGGSASFVGAPCFSAMSAIRSGAGLTTLCIPHGLRAVYLDANALYGYTLDYMPDAFGMHLFDPECAQRIAQNATVIAIGMGMGNTEETAKYVEYFVKSFDGTLVIDADGINVLASNPDILKEKGKAKIILTPHVGEFLRLNPSWDKSVESVAGFAKENGVCIVVKSAVSIITDGEQIALNVKGSPALAKGGSGDVLAGIIGSMSAIYSPFEAIKRACYYLGAAAEHCLNTMSELSLTPRDIIEALPYVLR